MEPEPLVRTAWTDPEGLPRSGPTGRGESRVDTEQHAAVLERAHGGALHTSGVASGLDVTVTEPGSRLLVAPGIALDPRGRHVCLAGGGLAVVAEGEPEPVAMAGVAVPCPPVAGVHHLTVAFTETFDNRGHTESQFTVYRLDHTPQLALVAPGDEGDGVVLARLELDTAGRIVDLAPGPRRVVGAPVEQLTLTRPVVDGHGIGATVRDRTTARILARPEGGLRLEVAANADKVEIGVADASAPGLRRFSVAAAEVLLGGDTDAAPLRVERAGRRVGINEPEPLTALHVSGVAGVRGVGGTFGNEDADGVLTSSGVTVLARSHAAAFGVVNKFGRLAFALGVDRQRDEPEARGVPTFWVRDGGVWQPTLRLVGDRVGIGTARPAARLTVVVNEGPGIAVVQRGTGPAVTAESQKGTAVSGRAESGPAVCGVSGSGTAVIASSREGIGLHAKGKDQAAQFVGDVRITGTLSKQGGEFLIDHPLAPADRYLRHSFVESDERKNVYDGVVDLDDDGAAEIVLDDWCPALNEHFRYQLTPVGEAAPNLHVACEIVDGRFRIAGGPPHGRACWQLTGVRRDAYARAHPLLVEEDKPAAERGHFLSPELFGRPVRHGIAWAREPRGMRMLALRERGRLGPATGNDDTGSTSVEPENTEDDHG